MAMPEGVLRSHAKLWALGCRAHFGCEGRAGLEVLLLNTAEMDTQQDAAGLQLPPFPSKKWCTMPLLPPQHHNSCLISSLAFFLCPILFWACGARQDTCQIFAESRLWLVCDSPYSFADCKFLLRLWDILFKFAVNCCILFRRFCYHSIMVMKWSSKNAGGKKTDWSITLACKIRWGEGISLYRQPQILNYSDVLVINSNPGGEINQFSAAADSNLTQGQNSLSGETQHKLGGCYHRGFPEGTEEWGRTGRKWIHKTIFQVSLSFSWIQTYMQSLTFANLMCSCLFLISKINIAWRRF